MSNDIQKCDKCRLYIIPKWDHELLCNSVTTLDEYIKTIGLPFLYHFYILFHQMYGDGMLYLHYGEAREVESMFIMKPMYVRSLAFNDFYIDYVTLDNIDKIDHPSATMETTDKIISRVHKMDLSEKFPIMITVPVLKLTIEKDRVKGSYYRYLRTGLRRKGYTPYNPSQRSISFFSDILQELNDYIHSKLGIEKDVMVVKDSEGKMMLALLNKETMSMEETSDGIKRETKITSSDGLITTSSR